MSRDMIIPEQAFPLKLEGFSLIDELDCERQYQGEFSFNGSTYHMMISIKNMPKSAESIYLMPVKKVIISEAEQDDSVVDEFIKTNNQHLKECGKRYFS